eukprot:GHVO01023875.1.p1 GENE.GHVO01023875.1~~GHVO01023875.1.p1  ORF type:complete len:1789 (+),score=445.91 GHVO01023875.1:44-5368(+)
MAEDRLTRARQMKQSVQRDVTADDTSVPSPPHNRGRGTTRIDPSSYPKIQKVEQLRLQTLQNVFRSTTRTFADYHFSLSVPLLKLADAVDRFNPHEDMDRWISSVAKVKSDAPYTPSTAPPVLKAEELSLLRVPGSGAGGDTNPERIKIALKNKHAQLIQAKEEIQTYTNKMRESEVLIQTYKNENDVLRNELSKLKQKSLKLPIKQAQASLVSERTDPPTAQRTQGGASGESRRGITEDVPSSAPRFSEAADVPLDPLDEIRSRQSGMSMTAPYMASSSRPSDMLPNLWTILEPPTKCDVFERMIEIQRRYEEFLMQLRNLDTSRMHTDLEWDCDQFYRTPEYEEGFEAIPFKVPAGSHFDTSQNTPRLALEWGAKRLDDDQWRCIAYETLLLCVQHLVSQTAARQLIELPHRSIAEVDVGSYLNSADAKPGKMGDDAQVDIMMAEENLKLVKRLAMLTRVKLGISGSVNTVIVNLTLPGGGSDTGDLGCWESVNPLDVRYRVIRLLQSWLSAKNPVDGKQTINESPVARKWVLRQLHTLHCSLTFKIARLQKFLPRENNDTSWLNDWTDRGPWYRGMVNRLPRFTPQDDAIFGGKLSFAQTLSELCLATLTGLTRAIDLQQWGRDVGEGGSPEDPPDKADEDKRSTDVFRSGESIIRLFQMMSMLESLDRAIRRQISHEEQPDNMSPTSRMKHAAPPPITPTPRSRMRTGSGSIDPRPNPMKERRKGVSAPREAVNFNVTPESLDAHLKGSVMDVSLSHFWMYETPLLQLILSYIWRACCENTTGSKLAIDAPNIANAILVTTCVLQDGKDLTGRAIDVDPSICLFSFQSHAMMLAQAMWEVATAKATTPTETDFSLDDIDLSKPSIGIIPHECVEMLYKILTRFGDWVVKGGEEQTDTSDALILTAKARGERLRQVIVEYVCDAILRPRSVDESNDAMIRNPDFFVIDVVESRLEVGPVLPGEWEAFHQVRDRPEGISLMMEGRVERATCEVLFRRMMSSGFRTSLFAVLTDYRLRIEPQTLPLLVKCWDTVQASLIADPPAKQKTDGQSTEMLIENLQFAANVPLQQLLKGPSKPVDMYRYFVDRSIKNLFERCFKDAVIAMKRDAVHARKDRDDVDEETKKKMDDESAEVLKLFSAACTAFLDEIRCELEYYPTKWKSLLPGNQHPIIVMFSCRKNLHRGLCILTSSPYWPTDDVPNYGSIILKCIWEFGILNYEVSNATHVLLSDKPDLLDPFQGAVTGALKKRFATVANILKRCMDGEDWVPLNPPSQLYSPSLVDLFSFIYHILDAANDLCAPNELVLPIFLNFLSTVSTEFANHIIDKSRYPSLMQLTERAKLAFCRLQTPDARVDISGFHGIYNIESKKKKGAGGILAGFGWAGGGKKAKPVPPPADAEATVPTGNVSADESSESEEDRNKSTKKKKDKKKKKKAEPVVIRPELLELADKVGPEITVALDEVGRAFETSTLLGWQVRMHNMLFFCGQLPLLADKFVEFAKQKSRARDPRGADIKKVLMEAAGGKKRKGSFAASVEADASDDQEIQKYQDLLMGGIDECVQHVMRQARELTKYVAMRLIYVDIGMDIFEDLYAPSFESQTLESIVNALRHTLDRFVEEAPESLQPTLHHNIIIHLCQAWMLLLTEMGYTGRIYGEAEMRVLDEDLEVLKDYTARHNVSEYMDVFDANGTVSSSIKLFDTINDFFVLISNKPDLLATLGGNITAEDIKKAMPTDNRANKDKGLDNIFGKKGKAGGGGGGVPPIPLIPYKRKEKRDV